MLEPLTTVERLSALAHVSRLEAFRLLVRAGNAGLSAGELADRLDLGATATSFHLNRLRQAGLVRRRRAGQQLIYSAEFQAVRALRDFLDAECCADTAAGCPEACGNGDVSGAPEDEAAD